jgi:hypothetical protein
MKDIKVSKGIVALLVEDEINQKLAISIIVIYQGDYVFVDNDHRTLGIDEIIHKAKDIARENQAIPVITFISVDNTPAILSFSNLMRNFH